MGAYTTHRNGRELGDSSKSRESRAQPSQRKDIPPTLAAVQLLESMPAARARIGFVEVIGSVAFP